MTEVVESKKAVPVDQTDIEQIAFAGEQHQEHLSKDDITLPYLQLLQALSPQCTKGQAEWIKGAKPSDVCDVSGNRVFRTKDDDDNEVTDLTVMPIVFKSCYTEWIPRSQGGGFIHEWSVSDGESIIVARNEAGQDIIQQNSPLGTPGNQLNRTHTHLVYVVENDRFWPAVISMQATQLKPSRDWNRLVQEQTLPEGQKAPRFFAFWNVTSALRTNDKGSWFLWKFVKAGDVLDFNGKKRMEIFHAAKAFVEANQADEVQINYADVVKTESVSEPVAEVTEEISNSVNDDDIPF